MTQAILTLAPDSDEKRMLTILENIEGIINIQFKNVSNPKSEQKAENILNKIREMRKRVHPELIDMSDDKTY